MGSLQETQAENEAEGDLLLVRHLELENDPDRECVGQEIRENVEGSVGEVENVDVDAFSGASAGPGHADGLALEGCDENEGGGLTDDDAHHHIGHAGEDTVSQSGVEPQGRCLDEAQTSQVEHRTQPDGLWKVSIEGMDVEKSLVQMNSP